MLVSICKPARPRFILNSALTSMQVALLFLVGFLFVLASIAAATGIVTLTPVAIYYLTTLF